MKQVLPSCVSEQIVHNLISQTVQPTLTSIHLLLSVKVVLHSQQFRINEFDSSQESLELIFLQDDSMLSLELPINIHVAPSEFNPVDDLKVTEVKNRLFRREATYCHLTLPG